MNEFRKLLLPIFFVVSSVGLWWIYKKPASPPDPGRNDTAAPSTADERSGLPDTESHWLVDEIGRDITEILHFAKGKAVVDFRAIQSPDRKTFQFLIGEKGGDLSAEITPSHYLWSPEAYGIWAKACIDHLELQPAPPSGGGEVDLIGVLSNPSPAILIEQSKRISERLTQEPMAGEWHEQSALLIGTFALREAANMFHDPRREMCRMTAHLALARSLQPEYGPCGTLANLVLLTLAGRQQEAIDGLPSLSAGSAAWSRALHLRNTGDWRTIKEPVASSLLEKWELARALNVAIGPGKVVDLLEKLALEPSPDWNRIIMQRSFGVAEGHQFVHPGLKAEIEEFATVYQLRAGDALEEGEWVAELNTPPSRTVIEIDGKPELQALNWGMFAAFHQRHLCQSMVLTHTFLEDKWGVDDQAASFVDFVHEQFSELRLFPLVSQRIVSRDADYETVLAKAAAFCEENPTLISASNWVHLLERKDIARRPPVRIPSPNSWFSPDLPPGTIYDFANRYYDLHQLYKAPDDFWDEIILIAPYHFDVIRTHRYEKFGSTPSPEETRTSFARIIDFHFVAMGEYCDQLKGDPEAYAKAVRQASELDPDILIKAAGYFVTENRTDLALEFYEAGFAKAEDRVRVSNGMRWLVDYYFDNDRKEDALKVATEGAEVYSNQGLETMGHLMERMGDLGKAEENYLAIEERYGDASALMAFYARYKDSHPNLAGALEKRLGERFPGGLQKVAFAEFTDPPLTGCELTSDSTHTREAGLKSGDVIVAYEGYRVGNAGQYMVIRELADTLPIHLIIWDGRAYREVEAAPPGRRFQCEIGDYEP